MHTETSTARNTPKSHMALVFGVIAFAAPLFYSHVALASDQCTTADGTVVTISEPTSCEFVVSGSCATQCTTSAFATECAATCSSSTTSDAGTTTSNTACEASCATNLMTHCTTECSAPHGALFCNGQYIDVSAISQCSFTISASGTASGGVSCAVSPGTHSSHEGPVGLAIVAGLGFLVARRRRGV